MAKKMSETEVMILKAAQKDAFKDVEWFYSEVIPLRESFKDEKGIKKAFRGFAKKVEKVGLCHAKLVVEDFLGWQKGPDTDKRNRYLKMTNSIAVSNGYAHSDVHQLFLDASKKYLLEDYDHPADAFLTKKEARSARKSRKLMKKHGVEKEAKVAKSDDEKKEARKLRAAIRKKADELGIDREEFKNGLESGKYKL